MVGTTGHVGRVGLRRLLMKLLALSLSLLIPGVASPHCFGTGHARVTKFLMSSLQQATQQRYTSALQHLNSDLVLSGTWADLSDKRKDAVVADWMVEAHENDESKA